MKTAEREREGIIPAIGKAQREERNCTPNIGQRGRPEKSKKKKITKLYRTAGEVHHSEDT